MVRVNLIDPKSLADQHLIAEYNEILMLLGYVRKHPKREKIPEKYCLGPGHIRFFKDKLIYVKARHELVKKEMRRRKFKPEKTIDLKEFPKELRNDWTPTETDSKIIKERIIWKLEKKPDYYRYAGEHVPVQELVKKIRSATIVK